MRKLTHKEVALFKLAVWSCLVVWMIMFFAFSLATAARAAGLATVWFGTSTWGYTMTWLLPIWIVFTALLIIVLFARWAVRKLRADR